MQQQAALVSGGRITNIKVRTIDMDTSLTVEERALLIDKKAALLAITPFARVSLLDQSEMMQRVLNYNIVASTCGRMRHVQVDRKMTVRDAAKTIFM